MGRSKNTMLMQILLIYMSINELYSRKTTYVSPN